MAIPSIASPAIRGWQAATLVHSCAEGLGGRMLAAPMRLAKSVAGKLQSHLVRHELGRRNERVLSDMGLDAEAIHRRHERGVGVRRFGPQFPKV